MIEALAAMPEGKGGIPLEGFDPVIARLANIEDHLARLTYLTAHADPSGAPPASRPEMPHVARRRELKQRKARAIEMRLIPGGG
ncbi:hypothetical protein [Nocardia abscessus]|uniref:hypothetical protein n=1 Tax=Nocardia abscessus TaxID=120957 RepID=UPI002453E28E|nr:hypothetical protein [Nocardia abscessus]